MTSLLFDENLSHKLPAKLADVADAEASLLVLRRANG